MISTGNNKKYIPLLPLLTLYREITVLQGSEVDIPQENVPLIETVAIYIKDQKQPFQKRN